MSIKAVHELHKVRAKGQVTIKELKKDKNAMRNLRKGQLVLHAYPTGDADAAHANFISVKVAKNIRDERIYEHVMVKEAEKDLERADPDDKRPFLKNSKVAPGVKPDAKRLPAHFKHIIIQRTQITGKDIKRDPEIVRELMERNDIIIISKMKAQSLEEACTVSESCGLCLCCTMVICVSGMMGVMFANFN
jgi:hypothetical protein